MFQHVRRFSPLGRRLANECIATLYPPRCAGCGRRGHWVCPSCIAETAHIEPPYCGRCGEPVENACVCAEFSHDLDAMRSAAWYEGWLKTAIQQFKYEGERARAAHLGNLLVPLIDDFVPGYQLVPVPLHPDRKRWRGYNQSLLLAAKLSAFTGIQVSTVLLRTLRTRQQVGLRAFERAANVKGAFSVLDGSVVAGRTFVLIDDVTTTGATLGACAETLKSAGAVWVGAMTVARER